MNKSDENRTPRGLGWFASGIRLFAIVIGSVLATNTARAQTYEIVYDFAIEPVFNVESNPHGPLIRASDGNLYGTTFNSFLIPDEGTAFRFNMRARVNNLVILHNFMAGTDGYHPEQALLESSGYLFGSVSANVTCSDFSDEPSTYRMDFVGNLSTIACDPSTPDMSGLVAAYGGLWGIDPALFHFDTEGSLGLFRMETSGAVTIRTPLQDGAGAAVVGTAELLLATDGDLYGLASDVLFRSDSAGNVTIMHTFNAGDNPFGRLVEQGGFLWGTTQGGGAAGKGTMFRMDFAGNFATLHSFSGGVGDGAVPTGGLLVANLSSFYGTTVSGGLFDGGTLYQIDSFGNVIILHAFGDTNDGNNPGPLLAVNGALWGTTQEGGTLGGGTIYVLLPGSSPPAIFRLVPTAGPIRIAPGDPVEIHGGNFPAGEVPSVTFGGLAASNVRVLDQQNISASTPPGLSPGTLNEIIVVTPDGTETSLEDAWMADFLDVPGSDPLHDFVEQVFRAGLMSGCGGGNFCEGGTVDRATLVTMALKAKHGPAWAPPACTGIFKDVACPGPQADWVEDAVAEGIAQPCDRQKFCPDRKVTRDELPSILLATEHGATYVPPSCTGIFKDVKCPGPNADAIEQVYNEGVVEACSTDPLKYCPNRKVERGPMAEYAATAFRLP